MDIPTSSYEKQEFDDLDDYLKDDFNLEVYHKIRERRQIVPLAYFKSFYKMLSYLTANLKKPLAVEQRLREIDPDYWYEDFLLEHLLAYSERLAEGEGKPALRDSLSMKHIAVLKKQLDLDIEDEKATALAQRSPKVINRELITVHLDSLPDDNERKAYLLQKRTTLRYDLRNSTEYDEHVFRDALAWIEDKMVEVNEIENLARQDAITHLSHESDEYDPAKRGLDRQLAMLLLDELFPNLKNASKTAKADLLSLLTGWNSDGLRQKWTDYQRGNQETLAQDRAKVAEWKMKLKISD